MKIKEYSTDKSRLATITGVIIITTMLVFAASDPSLSTNGAGNPPTPPSVPAASGTREVTNAPVILVTDKDIEVNFQSGPSLYEAARTVASQACYAISFDYADTNTIALLQTHKTTYDPARPMPWRTVLRDILKPVNCGFAVNGAIQVMTLERYNEMERQLADEALHQNHERIELAIRDVTVRAALEIVAEKANIPMNFNYLPMQDATNQAMRLVSFKTSTPTEWRSVLNNLLDPCGLDFIEEDGAVKPMTKALANEKRLKQEQAKPLVRRIFPIKHANVADMMTQLKAMNILSPRGTLTPSQSEGQNSKSLNADLGGSGGTKASTTETPRIVPAIIANDIKENIERLTEMITKLDVRERQITIEARIIDVTDSDGQTLGILWDTLGFFGGSINWQMTDSKVVDKNQTTTTADNQNRSLTETASETRDNVNGGREISDITKDTSGRTRSLADDYKRTVGNVYNETRTAILGPLDVKFTIDALKTLGNAEMVSHPILVVGNRTEANIHVGQDFPTWTVTAQQAPGNTGATNTQYTYTDELNVLTLGLSLWVLPEISSDGKLVRLSITPSMREWIEDRTSKNGSTYPLTSTRSISTRVSVPSGKTLLLGGLVGVKNRKIEQRVPFLGDIPILGYLFRHNQDVMEKSNLIILLTPTILDEETPATGYEDFNRDKSDKLEGGKSYLRAATNQAVAVTNALALSHSSTNATTETGKR